jgi:hypothetical protein
MLDPRRLSIDEVTLLRQCSTPQFLDALARNGVRCASLWRDKTREHGVAETARLAGTQDLRFDRRMMGDGAIPTRSSASSRSALRPRQYGTGGCLAPPHGWG